MASDILVVDDEEDIRELVCGILDDEGHETRSAHDADSALAAISDRVPRLVFLDIWLQGSEMDGLQILEAMKQQHGALPVIMTRVVTSARCFTNCWKIAVCWRVFTRLIWQHSTATTASAWMESI